MHRDAAIGWGAVGGVVLGLLLILHQTGGGIQVAFGQPSAHYVWGFRWEQVEETQVGPPPPVSLPNNTREAWAVDLLARLGNTQPTPETVAFIVQWTIAEDACMTACGYSSAWERWNPLNTTQTGYGAYATINGDGVKAYPDYESGMQATVQTLSYGYYTEIVAGLQTNDPERALRGLYGSPWGTNAVHVEKLWRAL